MERCFVKDWGRVFVCQVDGWRGPVRKVLAAAGLAARVREQEQVLIKPNLVETLQPPITTPVGLVEALVEYLQEHAPELKIIIGEGCGATEYDTERCFETLGYTDLAGRKGIELLDLNHAPLVRRSNPDCHRWPEMHLPAILFESYLISVPVLKAHTLAEVTLSMKNMMGVAPPSHYQRGGSWKKASFHNRVHAAIFDLNRYRKPDFVLLDASVGMSQAHLWGPTCDPPPEKIVAGYDPVATDAYGAGLLCRDWSAIEHIKMADGVLGKAEAVDVVMVD